MKPETLLTGVEIKEIRDKFAMSNSTFAKLVGVTRSTLLVYLNKGANTPSTNNAIIAFSNPEFVRAALLRRGHLIPKSSRIELETKLKLDAESLTRLSRLLKKHQTGKIDD